MKKIIALLLALAMCVGLAACNNSAGNESQAPASQPGTTESEAGNDPATDGEKPSVGFVTLSTQGDFFQSLADTYVATMEAEGWEASYVNGEQNPATQIEAIENYVTRGVDVLLVWAVSENSVTSALEQAMAAGVKVISFVQTTEVYDALMLSDNTRLATFAAKMAAEWIDETFADAEDHSVPVVVLSCRNAPSGVEQGDVLIRIEEFSQKAKFVEELQYGDEAAATGQEAAENLYVTNPEVKVFITAHSGLAQGVYNYYTSMNSPVTDYSDMGIFCINGDNTIAEAIQASKDGTSPLRGTVMTGSVQDTANEMRDMIIGLYDGSVESGTVTNATTVFITADTVDEYLETGKVTSVTEADYE